MREIVRFALALSFVAMLAHPVAAVPKSSTASEGSSGSNSTCGESKVAFRGRCVEQDQCCEEDLCPSGTVFEFVKAPRCVPCAQAETESGAAYCAARSSTDADLELNQVYASLVKGFPSERRVLKDAERAWIVFRDKLCEAQANTYKGGSMEREILGRCLAAETRRQIDRLKELRSMWAAGTRQGPK